MEQISFFNEPPLKIGKPIRLIELFGIDDENGKFPVCNFHEAVIMTRDKADHLARLLAEISNRFGVMV